MLWRRATPAAALTTESMAAGTIKGFWTSDFLLRFDEPTAEVKPESRVTALAGDWRAAVWSASDELTNYIMQPIAVRISSAFLFCSAVSSS